MSRIDLTSFVNEAWRYEIGFDFNRFSSNLLYFKLFYICIVFPKPYNLKIFIEIYSSKV